MSAVCIIDKINCLIELHNHLDGSLSPANVRNLAELQNIEVPSSDEELEQILMVSPGCRDLNEFLEKFEFPNRLLQTKVGISQAVYNLQEEMLSDGYIYAEIRFAPQLSTQKGLTQEEVVLAALEGLHRSELKANLILCCMRGADNHSENLETVRLAAKYLGRGICAVDLAGAEGLFPTCDFTEEFELAKQLGVPATIHAGEADGPASVQAALEMGARRIGHGVRSLEDILPESIDSIGCEDQNGVKEEESPKAESTFSTRRDSPADLTYGPVIQRLIEEKIPLELCPTSNLLTCIYEDIKQYPIRKFMELGIPVSVNTDDAVVCHTDLRSEWKLLIDTFRLTEKEVRNILLQTADSAFASEECKEWMREQILADAALQ